jgi:hypothetical protein
VARRFSNPSWKVIVSASRGQYLKPGSFEPGFFSQPVVCTCRDMVRIVDSAAANDHHVLMVTNPCALLQSKKGSQPGTSDRHAR